MLNLDEITSSVESINWLSRVGCQDQIENVDCKCYFGAWNQVIAMRGDAATADAFDHGRSLLTIELGTRFRTEYRKWNDVAKNARDIVLCNCEERIRNAIATRTDGALEGSAQDLLFSFMSWDLIHFAIEFAYSDVIPPRFYTLLHHIYREGHFPCSWNMKWPDGKYVIY